MAAAVRGGSAAGQGLVLPASAWVAGGVALAAAGAATYFAVSSYGAEQKLKSGFDPTTGSYQGTRQQALLAQRNAALANICFVVAGAALATGAVVTLVGGGDDPPKAQLSASAGAGVGVGGLLLTGSF
jgi:hypothetical protein